MVRKLICDVCGKEIDKKEDSVKILFYPLNGEVHHLKVEYPTYDTHVNCAKELRSKFKIWTK